MTDIKELLNQGWVGAVIGAASLLLAVVLYLRSRAAAAIALQYDGVRLVGGKDAAFPQEVSVRFGERVVPRVTASKLFVWNAGRATVRGTDIVEADPLRVRLPGDAEVLKVSVSCLTRPVTQLHARPSESFPGQVLIEFDFLDQDDGAAIEVLHTGDVVGPELLGTVRGLPHGLKNWGRGPRQNLQKAPFPIRHFRAVLWFAVALGLSMMLGGLLVWRATSSPSLRSPASTSSPPDWVLAVFGLVYALMPGVVLWRQRRRFPSALTRDAAE